MGMTAEEARAFMALVFDGYLERKKKKTLYSENDLKPKAIIKAYYECIETPEFDTLVNNFRRRYILNENMMEQVHEKVERQGLGVVYEYIQGFDDFKSLNLYTLLKLHQLLYSKTPYPEFGGSFRQHNVFLPGTGTNLSNYDMISSDLASLYSSVQDIINEGILISQERDVEKIIPYIDRCVELKCKLIKIHPFEDGNGRSVRAFINLLFKIANIPLVYIKRGEKVEYHKAMNLANNEGNYDNIKTFYYYKIVDSIIDLDLEYNEENLLKEHEVEELEKKKEIKLTND